MQLTRMHYRKKKFFNFSKNNLIRMTQLYKILSNSSIQSLYYDKDLTKQHDKRIKIMDKKVIALTIENVNNDCGTSGFAGHAAVIATVAKGSSGYQ